MNLFGTFSDGWTIYLWLIAGGMIIIASIYWMRWGLQNEQFEEDIKYLVFNEDDQGRMSPEEYAKSREVLKEQMESRERHLALEREEKARKT